MFTILNGCFICIEKKYCLDRPIHKQDFIQYIPSSFVTVNNTNNATNINIPREDAYITLQNSFLGLEFEVLKKWYKQNMQIMIRLV